MNALAASRPENALLAPLAGYSDLAFRLLCRECGAAGCFTEMISARGLLHNSPGTRDLLRTHPLDAPLAVQLFGGDPSDMTYAVNMLRNMGFERFDINMGCSVPKVTRTGSGAALLRDIPRALAVAEAAVKSAEPGKVSCKLRLGWENGHHAWRALAPALADIGVGALTLHPRFARQGFTGQADWSLLAECAARVSVPVLASGDLLSARDGVRCLAESGLSGLMYARGALRDPAVFTAHRALFEGRETPVPTAASLRRLILRHAELAREYGRRGERGALLQMRSLVPRYALHLPGVRVLRQRLCGCMSWVEFEDVIEECIGGGKA